MWLSNMWFDKWVCLFKDWCCISPLNRHAFAACWISGVGKTIKGMETSRPREKDAKDTHGIYQICVIGPYIQQAQEKHRKGKQNVCLFLLFTSMIWPSFWAFSHCGLLFPCLPFLWRRGYDWEKKEDYELFSDLKEPKGFISLPPRKGKKHLGDF